MAENSIFCILSCSFPFLLLGCIPIQKADFPSCGCTSAGFYFLAFDVLFSFPLVIVFLLSNIRGNYSYLNGVLQKPHQSVHVHFFIFTSVEKPDIVPLPSRELFSYLLCVENKPHTR